ERKDGYWLEKNTIGTFCHKVLERYYEEKATDVTSIFEEEKKLIMQEYPAVRKEDIDRVCQEMRKMIDTAIEWTTAQGITVLSTEANFGKEEDGVATKGLKLKIGSRELLLTGSIDRVDQRQNGCSILDYKTGNSYFFKRDIDKHLQHYLYTLAEEELYKDQKRKIDSATYLFLEDRDNFVEILQDAATRKLMEQKMEKLLELLEKEDTAQEPCPCYVWDPQKNRFELGSEEKRQEAQESCRGYCKYADLCPNVR
ncbi:MAG: PD-(D/E)XK nuclease family protein, partial [Firmicutes bacterium]|nr:PD-(D/E)XK nuclease family protein [Bacillota bacterium]